MANAQTSASTKFYMNQANKIVDVLSEIVPTIYCDVFQDDFDIFMDGLWEKPDEIHPAILDQSILHVGETIETLEKIDWKSLSKEKQLDWLKRLDLQALLKSLRFRPNALSYFCEKNSLVRDKMTNVLQSMINWRNYGVGHKSVYKYEQMDERVFKLNILEPVWDFYDLLSRKYQVECEILRKTLREIEERMKYPETNIERLSQLSRKSEEMVRSTLKVLNIYVDDDGIIKGENESNLAANIKRLATKNHSQELGDSAKNSKENNKINKKTIFAIVIMLVLFAGAVFMGAQIFIDSGYTKVPNVVGMNVNKAENILKDEGLKVKIEYNEKAGIDKGEVISQSEKPNSKVKKNETIKIMVSSGMVIVPSVIGKNADEAGRILKNCHLRIERKYVYSEEIKKGVVINQSVHEGDRTEDDSLIQLTVSKGKKIIKVPNVEGKTYKKGKKILEQNGFKTKRVKKYSSSVTTGLIINTNPSVGKRIKNGTRVTVFVSKGENPNSVGSNNTFRSNSYDINNNVVNTNKNHSKSNNHYSKPKKSNTENINKWVHED